MQVEAWPEDRIPHTFIQITVVGSKQHRVNNWLDLLRYFLHAAPSFPAIKKDNRIILSTFFLAPFLCMKENLRDPVTILRIVQTNK